jgi:hypothetical protein
VDFWSQIEAETGQGDSGQNVNDIVIAAINGREDQAENRD